MPYPHLHAYPYATHTGSLYAKFAITEDLRFDHADLDAGLDAILVQDLDAPGEMPAGSMLTCWYDRAQPRIVWRD